MIYHLRTHLRLAVGVLTALVALKLSMVYYDSVSEDSNYILGVLRKDCYDDLKQLRLREDATCSGLALLNIATCIVFSAAVLRGLPQIQKTLANQSVVGLSRFAVYSELI